MKLLHVCRLMEMILCKEKINDLLERRVAGAFPLNKKREGDMEYE